jgi:hypothetical protein
MGGQGNVENGSDGVLGLGGGGGSLEQYGAGGGGGLYGGGGGAAANNAGGGGGGGSSFVPAGGISSLAALTTAAKVDITYSLPASSPPPPPPPPGPGGGPSGTPDTTRPVLSSVALSPTAFTAANAGPAYVAAVGTRVFFRLSEPASATFRVDRVVKGRKRGRRCVKSGPGKRCTRYVAVTGSFARPSVAGLNSLRFMGRLRGRALLPGKYRLVMVAVDAAGNRSVAVRRPFRIKAG